MPDLDGFEIALRLVADGLCEVVLISSRDASEYGAVVHDCGARGFIPKAELSGRRLAALLE